MELNPGTIAPALLDALGEEVALVDEHGVISQWDRATASFVPLGPTPVPPSSWPEHYGLFDEDGRRFTVDELPLLRALRGEACDGVLVHVSRPDRDRWISVNARPVRDADGVPRGGIAISRDVTARQTLKAAIADTQSQWQALVEQAPCFIVLFDAKGVIRFLNTPSTGPINPVGRDWRDFVPPAGQPEFASMFERVLASGERVRFETTGPAADLNGVAWYSCHFGPIRRDGAITGVIAIVYDVTSRKDTESQLIVADRMASVGSLAAGVAHEINTPLATIVANLDLAMRAQRAGQPATEELADAMSAAYTARQIVSDLNTFARAQDDATSAVDLEAVLESTLRLAWNEVRHRTRVVRKFDAKGQVEANEGRLGQVFLNLILNAAEAIPEGQVATNEITLATWDDGDFVVIAVSDTGSGMEEAQQRLVFTPFFTTKPVGMSSGLGLSICHRLITSLGGTITFRSTPRVGTTFTVRLPTSHRAAPEEIVHAAPALARPRVLLIDDDVLFTRTLSRLLADRYDVVALNAPREAARRIVAGERFDVILCDLMMPDMTGMEFQAVVAASAPEQLPRLVFVTGGAFTANARAFVNGTEHVVVDKPFEPAELRALLARMVSS